MPSAGHGGLVQLRKGGLCPGWRQQRETGSVRVRERASDRETLTEVWEGLKDGPDRDSAQEMLTVCALFLGWVVY